MSDPLERIQPELNGLRRSFSIAVTGGQGVGKSTFCRKLKGELESQLGEEVGLLSGLGDKARSQGLTVGTSADEDTVIHIFAGHTAREEACSHQLIILDRCFIDALAYLLMLNVTSPEVTKELDTAARSAIDRIDFLIVLELSETFAHTGGSHETPEFRAKIADHIDISFEEFGGEKMRVDASEASAIFVATRKILQLLDKRRTS